MDSLNCWIDRSGNARPVETGRHAVVKKRGDCIRISLPERRRTWLGVQCYNATPSAKATAKRILQSARRDGFDIIADVDGQVIECFQHDRPTELNKAFT